MASTAADVLIETIQGGVEVVFGLPGDGINLARASRPSRRSGPANEAQFVAKQ